MEKKKTCHYHDDTQAVSHCEKCGCPICIDCKKIYRNRFHKRTSTEQYCMRYEYCPVCYHSEIGKRNLYRYKTSLGASLVFFILLINSFRAVESEFLTMKITFALIALGTFIYGAYGKYVLSKRDQRLAKKRIDSFLGKEELGINSDYKISLDIEKKNQTLDNQKLILDKKSFYCVQCGAILHRKMKFCPSCGDDTKDELANKLTKHSKCYYHDDHTAVAHCEKCNRLICPQCKLIHRKKLQRKNYSKLYYERYEYCPVCKYVWDKQNLTKGYLKILLFLTFMATIMILAFSTSGISNGGIAFISLFLGIAYAFILYHMLIKSPNTRKYATKRLDQFIKEVKLDQNFNRMISDLDTGMEKNYKDLLVEKGFFYCAQCGSKLRKKDRFCPTCGDTTKDELNTLNTKKG